MKKVLNLVDVLVEVYDVLSMVTSLFTLDETVPLLSTFTSLPFLLLTLFHRHLLSEIIIILLGVRQIRLSML
jgi:hypothetical protein